MKVALVGHYAGMIRICELMKHELSKRFDLMTFYNDDPDGHEDSVVGAVMNFCPDFVVTPNGQFVDYIAQYSKLNMRTVLVNHGPVPHKNHRPVAPVMAVVGTPYANQKYRELGQKAAHWWDYGYIEMDGYGLGMEGALWNHPDDAKPFIVYAPTFHEHHAGPVKRQKEILAKLTNHGESTDHLVFAPHPIALHSDSLRGLAEHYGVRIYEGHGTIVRLLSDVNTKVVITDYSAVIPLAFGCGVPVFAYNSFRWWQDPAETFSTEDPILEMREACYQFTSVEELVLMLDATDLLGSCPKDPLYPIRREWQNRIFGGAFEYQNGGDSVAERVSYKLKQLGDASQLSENG